MNLTRRRLVLGQGSGRHVRRLPAPPAALNVDAIHTALGLLFTTVWLLVGQILVANR